MTRPHRCSKADRTPVRVRPRRAALVLTAVGLLVLAACGDTGDPQTVVDRYLIYDRNAQSGEYVLSEEKIATLNHLRTVTGDVADMQAGGNLEITDPDPQTTEEFEESIVVKGAEQPAADYEIRSNGLLVPWDFDSTMMFTIYHHFEEAYDFFVAHGVQESTIGQTPVYYNVSRQAVLPIDSLTDNAAYLFTRDAFLIPPSLLKGTVPLGANRGVIVHEFSHLIFNRLVENNERVPASLAQSWPRTARNAVDSLNEGLADSFAALQTEEPNFIGVSLPEGQGGGDRDVSEERFYDQSLYDCVSSEDPSDRVKNRCYVNDSYDPYQLGKVVAATNWEVRESTSITNEELTRSLLQAMREMSSVSADAFDTARFFNELRDELPSAHRAAACNVFENRLTAIQGKLSCGS